jgi:hypothetical protein
VATTGIDDRLCTLAPRQTLGERAIDQHVQWSCPQVGGRSGEREGVGMRRIHSRERESGFRLGLDEFDLYTVSFLRPASGALGPSGLCHHSASVAFSIVVRDERAGETTSPMRT